LDFIHSIYFVWQKAIHKLEQKGLTEIESLIVLVVSEVWNALNAIKRRYCKEKMHSVPSKNAGYHQ